MTFYKEMHLVSDSTVIYIVFSGREFFLLVYLEIHIERHDVMFNYFP